MTFYIVRHAESEANVAHVFAGHIDPKLTEKGEIQAAKRAQDLKGIDFAAAFSSDLIRAKRTAEIIAMEHKLEVQTTTLLREKNFGNMEGKRVDQLELQLQKALDEYNKLSTKERAKVRLVDDMENDEEIVTRFITFLRETAIAYPDKNILIVSHGTVMRTFLFHLGFGTPQELPHTAVDNTAYIKLFSDGVEFIIQDTVGIHKAI